MLKASPTHASTKHVPRLPTYHHKICVSIMYQDINDMQPTIYLKHMPNHVPSINHVPKHQPYTKSCINMYHKFYHTMCQHLYHIMYQQCTIPCINHVHHPCINHAHQPCTITSASTIFHITHSMYHNISSMRCLNQVHNNQDHIPSICLNHAPKMCLKHVPMPQQYTKNKPQACTITSSTCNQTIYQDSQ
jgi:hypothetical protein